MTALGSFCSGYGGLDLAVAAHYGADHAWLAEVDSAACGVLERRFPGVPNLGEQASLALELLDELDDLEGAAA